MHEVPPFPDAVERFGEFLTEQGVSPSVEWIFSDDLLWSGSPRPFLRTPVRKDNFDFAAARYEQGRDAGRGVLLHVLFRSERTLLATVWFPESTLEAETSLVSGLKLSIAQPVQETISCRPGWRWNLRRWLAGDQSEWMNGYHLMSRGPV